MVARSAKVATIRVADIRSNMDWAYVRVLGVVTRHPSHEPSSGQLAFWLDDGTGEIRVTAYRPVSDRLLEAPQLPAMGDLVRVEGTLRLREDFRQLVVSLPSALDIERPTPVVSSIAGLTEEHVFRKVCLRGQVRDVRIPYEGLILIALRDATGAVDVVSEERLGATYGTALSLAVGEHVELCGAVTTYAGRLQLALDSVTVAPQMPAPVEIVSPRQIARIGHKDVGQFVRLRGTVSAVAHIGSGLRLLVDDGSGTVVVVVWQDVAAQQEDLDDITQGTPVDVQGRVAEYRGQLEVIPEIVGDIRCLGPPTEATAQLRLDQIGVEQLGDRVVVEAQIVYSIPSPSGVRFGLSDGNAEGYLLAWANWLASCPAAAQLVPGAQIRARGLVNLYEGRLEIVPQHSDDVIVTAAGALAEAAPGVPAEPTAERPSPAGSGEAAPAQMPATPSPVPSSTPAVCQTGAVLLETVGERLTVQGMVVDLVLFASGQRCQIDDGSGPLAMWLPKEPFAALYGDVSWQFGSVVRAHGLVQLYKGEVELVPASLGDVWIVQAAPPLTAPVTRMADLREGHVGERITVEGRVVEVRPFSQGIKYLLDDGSGRLTMLLWQSVLDDLPGRECLALGSLVWATGRVSAFQGALELAPGIGRDVICRP
jgi:DNA/RNA endonuclease YhcR with UshA esterase domain